LRCNRVGPVFGGDVDRNSDMNRCELIQEAGV